MPLPNTILLEKYLIGKLNDKYVIIEQDGGESGVFELKKFEEMVDKFYKENF